MFSEPALCTLAIVIFNASFIEKFATFVAKILLVFFFLLENINFYFTAYCVLGLFLQLNVPVVTWVYFTNML